MSKIFTRPHLPLDWQSTPQDFTGDNNLGIYTKETTQRFVYGTRYLTWDGRVYKYMGLTTGGCTSYDGVQNTSDAELGWTANAVEVSAGGRLVSITEATLAEDALAGAMLMAYNSTIENSTHHMIVGNDACGATYTNCYLEFPLPVDLDATDTFEVFANPYKLVSASDSGHVAWMGVPMVTALTGYNVWVQTWGPSIISPGNTTLDDRADYENVAHWSYNGKIRELTDAEGHTVAGKAQVAGYILNEGTADIAGPQIYLMCST